MASATAAWRVAPAGAKRVNYTGSRPRASASSGRVDTHSSGVVSRRPRSMRLAGLGVAVGLSAPSGRGLRLRTQAASSNELETDEEGNGANGGAATPAAPMSTRRNSDYVKKKRVMAPAPTIGLYAEEQAAAGGKAVDEEEAAVAEMAAGAGTEKMDMMAFFKDKLVLTCLLAAWYASNIFYNIYNKQVMQQFPLPTSCTFVHLITATMLMGLMWLLKIKKAPPTSKRLVQEVVPLSVLHLVGFLTTNMSLGAVNVSLTHTIKSMEPFFTVVLSYFFLGSIPSLPVMLTLVPIVAGVVVASATDLSFNWYGFATAMGSNLAFQSRNVISKKYMVENSFESLESGGNNEPPLDEINLFACISVLATVLMVPVVLLLDGPALWARYQLMGANIMTADAFFKTCMAGICRTGDVLSSYALLSRLNPVTHSVSNCVKRVVVIVVSLIFFKTPVTMLNIIGTGLALSGVFAYSMAKRMTPDQSLKKNLETKSPWTLERLMLLVVPDKLLEKLVEAKAKRDQQLAEEKKKKAEGEGPTPEFNL